MRFSLVEGLVAIIVLAIVLVGAAPFFYAGHSLIHRSRLKREAVEIAAGHLEELTAHGFEGIAGDETEVTLGDGITATMTTEVEDTLIDGDGNGYRQVAVSIEWTFNNKPNDVSMVTYVTNVSGAF